MSRRNRANGNTFVNNVRGPTSALTSFLNERGIRRANPAPAPAPVETPPTPPTTEDQDIDITEAAAAASSSSSAPTSRTARLTRGRTTTAVAVSASTSRSESIDVDGVSDEDDDDDDDDDDEQEVDTVNMVQIALSTRPVRASRSRAAVNTAAAAASSSAAGSSSNGKAAAASKAKAAAAASKKRPRKKGEDSSDDDNEIQHENAGYPSRSGFSHKGRMPRSTNKIEFCSRCRARFTVKAGTTPAIDEDDGGLLCPTCAGESGPVSASQPKPKPVKKARRKAQKAEIECQVPSLQDLCITKIATCIEDVEGFGDISAISMDKICKIICRNRSLNTETLQLFLDARLTELVLYDCTEISAEGLQNIAQFSPELRSLELKFCGRITNDVLDYYSTHLTELTSLSLLGPILILEPSYVKFFESVGERLERFELKSSSRFSLKALETLCERCPNLTHLRLSDCNLMDDTWLTPMANLTQLLSLRIRNPEPDKISTEAVVKLIQAVGSGLEELELKGISTLEDAVLIDAIRPCCVRLERLNLMGCEDFTTEGIETLFKDWNLNRGLTYVNLENCVMLKDEALTAITGHSAGTLERLSIKGLDELTKDALLTLKDCEGLTLLDASWCRAMDDEVMEVLVKAAPKLSKVTVWGDHRLTECCPTREGLKIVGREGDYIDLRFM
ncbi:hypothetical protein BGZ83_002985 [Gryganskiella cystojenkinii]|nr:hypothetical protein BGZ83_002985 [Gryganskiella cystojenkinii]